MTVLQKIVVKPRKLSPQSIRRIRHMLFELLFEDRLEIRCPVCEQPINKLTWPL